MWVTHDPNCWLARWLLHPSISLHYDDFFGSYNSSILLSSCGENLSKINKALLATFKKAWINQKLIQDWGGNKFFM